MRLLEIRINQEDDYRAISALIAGFARALDCRDWATAKTMFTGDAVAYGDSNIGPDAIVAHNRRRLAPSGPTMHLIGQQTITLVGDEASAITQVRAFHAGAGTAAGSSYEVMGDYHDDLVRTATGWRFKRRRFDRRVFWGNADILAPA